MGSRAIAVSPDGKNVYVASSRQRRDRDLRAQPADRHAGPAQGGRRAASPPKAPAAARTAIGLDGPNSVAVSPDGRNVYATSRGSNSITASAATARAAPCASCRRQRRLHLRPADSRSAPAAGRCSVPTWSSISPDGSERLRRLLLRQRGRGLRPRPRHRRPDPARGEPPAASPKRRSGCAAGIGLGAVEGLAVSRDGSSVYAASAPLQRRSPCSARDPATGALTQATATAVAASPTPPLTGCATGVEAERRQRGRRQPRRRSRLRHLAVQQQRHRLRPDDHSAAASRRRQGTAGCLVWLRAVGCSFGRALRAPEGLAVSPDGANVYVAAFATGAIDVLDRNPKSGNVAQKPGAARLPRAALGRRAAPAPARCAGSARSRSAPTAAIVYSTSFGSNAVDIFRRNK